jgi:multidrug efflux pump subunit AcrA (membrane-fusion protein)
MKKLRKFAFVLVMATSFAAFTGCGSKASTESTTNNQQSELESKRAAYREEQASIAESKAAESKAAEEKAAQ